MPCNYGKCPTNFHVIINVCVGQYSKVLVWKVEINLLQRFFINYADDFGRV